MIYSYVQNDHFRVQSAAPATLARRRSDSPNPTASDHSRRQSNRLPATLARRQSQPAASDIRRRRVHPRREGYKRFKIEAMPRGVSDSLLWQTARRWRLLLMSADRDFWDDRAYPLRDSPGLFLLAGRTASDRLEIKNVRNTDADA